MSSPDEPGFRRRRRRSRQVGDDRTDSAVDRAATIPAAGEPDQDRAATGRPGRTTKPAGSAKSAGSAKPAKSAGSAKPAKSAGSAKSAGQRRQSSESSARTIRETERGWRDLAGSGSSQLGVSGALRARDVSRPGPAELAEAERTVQLVRRQWQPPAAD